MTPKIVAPVPDAAALSVKSLAALGWPELLDALARRAAGEPGKRACLEPVLQETAAACEQALQETEEMTALFESGDPPPAAEISDVIPLVQTTGAGGMLEPGELKKIMDLLEQTARTADYFSGRGGTGRLGEWARELDGLSALFRTLVRSIDPDGSVLDSASPELKSLRNRHRTLKERIIKRLNEIVAHNPDAVLQDSFFTQRGQRYVVPVKASEQQRFEGIVHEASGSGQTLFVEPAELVDQNNRLKLLESGIELEILRVLRDLSARVAGEADVIIRDQRVLTHLDVVRARARLARDLNAHRPRMNDQGRIALAKARHPLIVLAGQPVVANDVALGGDYQIMLVSGPNTGGKTVGLSLLGLCALMARAGMFLPADPGSEMAVLMEIYTVIGDEQDLARDLSSFSGHVLDLVGILAAAGPRSLVLLDELMSSTDPEEGTALAAAVLCALRDRGALVAATTHLPALKSFAHAEPGFMNASYTFDHQSLEPTYGLVMGLPGRSLGIEVAERIGLDKNLVQKAKAEMGESARRMESLLAEISKKLGDLAAEKMAVEAERRELESLAEEHRSLRRKAREQEKEFRATVKLRLREALCRVEDELKAIMAPLKAGQKLSGTQAQAAREKLRELEERTRVVYSDADESPQSLDLAGVKAGDRVMVMPLSIEAELVEKPAGEISDNSPVKVRMGKLTVTVPASRLRGVPAAREEPSSILKPAPRKKRKKEKSEQEADRPSREEGTPGTMLLPPSSKNTLDLRGLRVHEAEARVEEFLDSACRGHLANVFIIHGHGTGALKAMIRELLALSPYVAGFRPGEKGEGGDGVTMARLRELG